MTASLGTAVVRLRVLRGPRADLVLIDEYVSILDPTRELGECLTIPVLTYAAVESIVPIVDAADEIVAVKSGND